MYFRVICVRFYKCFTPFHIFLPQISRNFMKFQSVRFAVPRQQIIQSPITLLRLFSQAAWDSLLDWPARPLVWWHLYTSVKWMVTIWVETGPGPEDPEQFFDLYSASDGLCVFMSYISHEARGRNLWATRMRSVPTMVVAFCEEGFFMFGRHVWNMHQDPFDRCCTPLNLPYWLLQTHDVI